MNMMRSKLSVLSLAMMAAFNASADEAPKDDTEHIVVTGSRIEQKLEDVAGSVSVVTDKDIDRRLVTDLETMFRYDPSISTTGSGSSPQTITIRGIGGNRLVYIKDGRRSNDSYEGGGGFIVGRGYFDTDTIKQVEVAKSAASSLYGSDGLGGIVVTTTKDPMDYLGDDESFFGFSLGYEGESSQKNVSVAGAKKIGDSAISAVISGRRGKEVQNYNETLPGLDSDSKAALIKFTHQIDDQHCGQFYAAITPNSSSSLMT